MTDYVDKFDNPPADQHWLWWHFKRGGCFILANIANYIALAVVVWIIVTIIVMLFVKKPQSFAASDEAKAPDGTNDAVSFVSSSPLILLLSVLVIGGVLITANSIGAEVYGRLWRPCEQAEK